MGSSLRRRRLVLRLIGVGAIACATPFFATSFVGAAASTAATLPTSGNTSLVYPGAGPRGALDCNGFSPVQKPSRDFLCADIRGFESVSNQNTWGGHFYDNGHYIGHDEPDTTFLSTAPGSGGNVTWAMTLGKDPAAAPTNATPGSDVSNWFELSPAPWLSMALCDPNSYPLLPCTPNSDANAPSGRYPGAGAAFMEMQFYPPGMAPFVDSISCDNTHWCAALTIDSAECTDQFAQCNVNCEEPLNAAFITTDGKPSAPPSPQAFPANQFPGPQTLLLNPGDRVKVKMGDAPVPGERGQHALLVTVDDLTTGQSGFMQASAKNGFQNTSITDCSGKPFNFEPEYSTASAGNYVPWTALQANISTEFETGHWEPCASLSQAISNPFDPKDRSTDYNNCTGAYERAGGTEGPEKGDAECYLAGSTHNGYAGPGTSTPPNETTGCETNVFQNGDLNFDGSPYWTEWPVADHPTSLYPSSFVESLPSTVDQRTRTRVGYQQFFFQTDTALSEFTCTFTHQAGCTIPPNGPGHFYPYWSEHMAHGVCVLEFGNVSTGVDTFGKDAQYGTNQFNTLGYPEFESSIFQNTCPPTS